MIAQTYAMPWYRERWFWLVAIPPILAVIAGFITLGYAIKSDDGLVDKSYYESGITINQRKERLTEARTLALSAQLEVSNGVLRVSLHPGAATMPVRLLLHAQFASRAQADRTEVLNAVGPGIYQAEGLSMADGRWYLSLEDDQHKWLMDAEMNLPANNGIVFVPEQGRMTS